MKIIACTAYKFIVEMDPSELEQLCLSHQRLNGRVCDHLGKDFEVDPAYRLAALAALRDNKEELERIIGQFKAMGELLAPVVTEVETLTGGEGAKL